MNKVRLFFTLLSWMVMPVVSWAQLDRGGVVSQQPTAFKNVWALSIGISKYVEYVPRLEFADDDAQYFHEFITTAYSQKNYAGNNFRRLIDQEATKNNFNKWVNEISPLVGRDDLVIFYFAGHGYVGKDPDNHPGYLLLYKAKPQNELEAGGDYISLYNLMVEELSKFTAKGAKVLLILDACHSGSVQNQSNVYEKVKKQAGSIFSILACQSQEAAHEDRNYGEGHGLFTWMLVRGLAGEAERTPDGVITYDELSSHLQSKVGDVLSKEYVDGGKVGKPKRQTPEVKGSEAIVFPYEPKRFEKFWKPSETAVQEVVQANNAILKANEQKLYQQLRDALARKAYLPPDKESVADLFARLYAECANQDLLAPIYREWQAVFQNEARQMIDAYVKQDQIVSGERYDRAAQLLAACLKYPQYARPGQIDLMRSAHSFLYAYANYTLGIDGKLTMPDAERRRLYKDLIRQVSADTAYSDQSAALHNVIGLLANQLGDTTLARAAYTRASQLAPGWVMPANNLATMEATTLMQIAGYQRALENNPTFYISLLNIADKYRIAKNFDKALEYLGKAKTSADKDTEKLADVYRHYGMVYDDKAGSDSTQYQQSLRYYQLAAQTGGTAFIRKHDLDWTLGWVYMQVRQYDKSAAQIDAYMESAIPELKDKRAKDKYNEFKKSVANEPTGTNGSWYYSVGYCYEKGYGVPKNTAEARRWYTFAVNYGFWQAIDKLAQVGVDAATITRHKRNRQRGPKRFTLSCPMTDGTTKSVYYILSEYPADTSRVYAEEADRIQTALGAKIPDNVADAFQKLYRIASKNNVSYIDLCLYALKAANGEKSKTAKQQQQEQLEALQEKALTFAKINRADSVLQYTNRAVLTLDLDLQKPDETARMLLDSIQQGANHEGLYYYALGYLYECKPSGREWRKAERWYTYAFQIGYEPAYFRLLTRAKQVVSSSAAIWLTDNYNRGVKGYTVKCTLVNGSTKSLGVYLQDFPQSSANPLQQEEMRLKDVYGATPTDNVRSVFARYYAEAQKTKQSFIDYSKQKLAAQSTQTENTKQTEADKLVAAGDVYYDKGQYAESIPHYRKAVAASVGASERSWCYIRLGNAMLADKQYETAIESFRTSIALQIRASAYSGLGIVYRLQHKTDKSVEALEKAIQLQPQEAYYHRMLGLTHFDANQYEPAINAYQQSLKLDPKNSEATFKVGMALMYLKRYDECLTYLDRCAELNPSAVGAVHYVKGLIYTQQKNWPSAIDAFQKAVETKPTDSDYLTGLGTALYRSGQYAKCIDVYQRVLAINPKDIDALNSIGISLTYLKRYDEGLAYLRKGIEADPKKAGLFIYNMACNYALQGKQADALRYLDEAIGKHSYGSRESILGDTDFSGMKNTPAFKALLDKYFTQ